MSLQAAVIGLGKLGAPLAGVVAAAGIDTCVFDRHQPTLRMVADHIAPVPEAGLQELLERAGNRLRPCVSIADAVRLSDISFVVVPTPSGIDARFDVSAILDVMEEIGSALAREPDYHVVVITSTVNPGDTSGPIRAALEQASGRVCGSDFGLVYNPEFIALGSVIKDMMTPDFLLIGSDDDRATEAVLDIYRRIHQDLPPAAVLTPVNAEIAKLAVNTFVTTKISFANMLAQVCEALPGGDVDQVTSAVGMDARIGPRYLRGGLGYGGPCFPRDNASLAATAAALGVEAAIPMATDRVNSLHAEHVASRVRDRLPEGGTVAILGLAYKPGTGIVEASAAVDLAVRIGEAGFRLRVHDPMAAEAALPFLPDGTTAHGSVAETAAGADVLVLATPWPEYRDIEARDLPRDVVVMDPWRYLPAGFGDGWCEHVLGGRSR